MSWRNFHIVCTKFVEMWTIFFIELRRLNETGVDEWNFFNFCVSSSSSSSSREWKWEEGGRGDLVLEFQRPLSPRVAGENCQRPTRPPSVWRRRPFSFFFVFIGRGHAPAHLNKIQIVDPKLGSSSRNVNLLIDSMCRYLATGRNEFF